MSQDKDPRASDRAASRRFTAAGLEDRHDTPRAPVRDDSALGPTEDLDRDLDGVPHDVVGLTAFFSVLLAMLIAFMVLAGGMVGRIAAVIIAGVATPVVVTTLRRRADRRRDHLHPSR
jgi:Flp pilus assembly protein TadB